MAKEKKPLTPTQQKKKYKTISLACFLGQFASVAAPFIVIGIVNFNEYFVEYDGVKMSIASIIAATIMGLAIWLVSKKKLENSYIVLIVGWAAVTGIFFLIGKIIEDIKYIMAFGLIGLVGALVLDKGAEKAEDKADQIQKGIDAAKEQMTKDAYIDEINQEKEKKTIKIKRRKDD